ncbi:MAG: hypothetical protein INR65_20250 [Gluconacetobacter diazotrophicus]|nr:hypothetical protein [Gluconacetobacter diazotrophicus]
MADVAAVPLYANYVIPRYLLAAVFLSWVLAARASWATAVVLRRHWLRSRRHAMPRDAGRVLEEAG